MTPSMPSETTRSATTTSISVKPNAARLTSRIGNALLVFVFGRRLGLILDDPVAIVLALLDAQVAIGERRDPKQGGHRVALQVQLERNDFAARQDGELR